MKLITLSEKLDTNFEGIKAEETDYDLLLDEDAKILKPDGSLLCILLKRAIRPDVMKSAWPVIDKIAVVSKNRGVASGEEKTPYVRADGVISNTNVAESVNSGILGFFERTARFPYCRACSWNLENPDKWAALVPVVKEVDTLFKLHAPERYKAQAKVAAKSHKDFLIPGTHFSTLTLNKNFRTAYHRDAGNLKEGISCMSVTRAGKWSGANLVFPAFRVAVKLDSLDLIIFDPHEVHGNTRLLKLSEDAVRCSIVYYFREKIQHCMSAAEEQQTVKSRKQGEQLFRTIIRRPNGK